VQHPSELGTFAIPDPDQVPAVDGELLERRRAVALGLDERTELLVRLELSGGKLFRAQVGVLVVDELEGELAPVARQKATSLHRARQSFGSVCVPRDDRNDSTPQVDRVAQTQHHLLGDLRAHGGVVGPGPTSLGLAEVVQQRREPHREACAGIGGGLDDREAVFLQRHRLPPRAEPVPDRLAELGQDDLEHSSVAREQQSAPRLAAEQEE
jgi:hypothetical protein